MMGGKKTVGQIYHEAVAQLKANYFQHVGISGILVSASLTFSSLLMFVFFAIYFFILMASVVSPLMAFPLFMNDDWGWAAAAFVPVLLISLVVLLFLFVLFFVVFYVVMLATNTVQTSMQKAVLLLVKGDKLTWHVVWVDFKKNWKRYLGVAAWSLLWTFLWSLLFYVPGVIKGLSYSMAPYLVIEHPELTVRQALKKSTEITEGHKGKLFLILLIQMGFTYAASIVASFGVIYASVAAMILWIFPLYYAMMTIAYVDLKQAAVENGLLPGAAPAEEEYPMAIEGNQPEASQTPGQEFTELEDDSPAL